MIALNKHNHLPASLSWYSLAIVILYFVLPLALIAIAGFFASKYIVIPGIIAHYLWIALAVYLLLIIIGYLLILLRYAFTTFVVTNNEITIATGILLRRFKSVSFDQVQDIDITMGVLKSIFGLGDMNIWTASQSQTGNGLPRSDAMLTLESKDAEWLKNFILDNRPGA